MLWNHLKAGPLSAPMAWGPLGTLEGRTASELLDAECARLKQYVAAIANADDPARELATKASARAKLREFSANKEDVADIRQDVRVAVSGVGAAASGMVAGDVVEGYVQADTIDALVQEYLLEERCGGNVRLRDGGSHELGKARVAADLADWGRARELGEANRIVDELLQEL